MVSGGGADAITAVPRLDLGFLPLIAYQILIARNACRGCLIFASLLIQVGRL